MNRIDWIIITIITLVCFVLLKDLFLSGYYTSHDGIHQVVRLYTFDQALRDGQIPPRWAGELLNGFGYPLFSFSYHLPWYIGEILHLAGLSIFDSIKMTFLIGYILSGATMYIFQRELYGRWGALVGSFVYLIAPYRFSNIFVRGAIGDATAFIFPPLLFLSAYKLRESTKKWWMWICIGSIAIAGLLLTHAMVFLFFLMSYVLYILFQFFLVQNRTTYLFRSLLIPLLGMGVSAYYFIPSVIERNYTKFNEIMQVSPMGSTFLKLKDLIYSPWGYGTMDAPDGKMSFQLGIAQWVIIASYIGISAYFLLRRGPKKLLNKLNGSYYYFGLFIFSIFLVLPVSKPIWQLLNKIAFIDLVWRVLAVSIFAVSLVAGFVIYRINHRFVFGTCIIILALYANRNHLNRNMTLGWPLEFYLKLESTTNSFDEYIPKWVNTELLKKRVPLLEYSLKDAQAKIVINNNKSNLIDFTLDTPLAGQVKLNKIYYPGWQAYVDGKYSPVDYSNGGLMQVIIDKGFHKIVFKFSDTPLRLFSNLISIGTIALFVFGTIKWSKL